VRAAQALELIQQALLEPVETWSGYSPRATPLCVYDKDEHYFLNHPEPPQERPTELTAATACEIGGVVTAVIPADMCSDERTLIPLLYHECFHAHQNGGAFRFAEQFDFFRCLAYYPELNAQYRALCAAEAEVLTNPELHAHRKAVYLAALARKRHSLLQERGGLLEFEGSSERREGTASYVEQKAALALFEKDPEPVSPQCGWSRQYAFGAAVCHLLEETLDVNWQAQVEQGAMPTRVLCDAFQDEEADLRQLHLEDKLAAEERNVEQLRSEVMAQVDNLQRAGITRVQLPQGTTIRRSFSPTRITSLGDGRLVHHGFLIVQLPSGTISVRGDLAVEDHEHGFLVLRRFPVHVSDGRLSYQSDTLSVSLVGVSQTAQGDVVIG